MNFRQALTPQELKAVLTPHLRLFLSIDVVGSTAFKHGKTQNGDANPWLTFIHGFFTGFPGILSGNVVLVKNENGPKTELPVPFLWKALGDELIFSIALSHPNQVRLYLKAFRLSLNKARLKWSSGESALPIGFKGTAWLAGFPVYNSAVPVAASGTLNADSEYFDFVGPLIDIGFRLSKFASERKFVISADIAWLVTKSGDTAGLNFYYDGREKLKGVLNDTAYPIFWVDCQEPPFASNTLEAAEDKLLGRDACKPAAVLKLADKFLASVKHSIPKPFFYRLPRGSKDFRSPAGFKQRLQVAKAQLSKLYTEDTLGAKRPTSARPGGPDDKEYETLIGRIPSALASTRKRKAKSKRG